MNKLSKAKNYIKEQIEEVGGLIDFLLVIAGLIIVVGMVLSLPGLLVDILSRVSKINLAEQITEIIGVTVFGIVFFGLIFVGLWIQSRTESRLGKWKEKRRRCHSCKTKLSKLSGAIRSDWHGNQYHYECVVRLAREI